MLWSKSSYTVISLAADVYPDSLEDETDFLNKIELDTGLDATLKIQICQLQKVSLACLQMSYRALVRWCRSTAIEMEKPIKERSLRRYGLMKIRILPHQGWIRPDFILADLGVSPCRLITKFKRDLYLVNDDGPWSSPESKYYRNLSTWPSVCAMMELCCTMKLACHWKTVRWWTVCRNRLFTASALRKERIDTMLIFRKFRSSDQEVLEYSRREKQGLKILQPAFRNVLCGKCIHCGSMKMCIKYKLEDMRFKETMKIPEIALSTSGRAGRAPDWSARRRLLVVSLRRDRLDRYLFRRPKQVIRPSVKEECKVSAGMTVICKLK